jgi:hypothetical protein
VIDATLNQERTVNFPLSDFTYFFNLVRGAEVFSAVLVLRHLTAILTWFSAQYPQPDGFGAIEPRASEDDLESDLAALIDANAGGPEAEGVKAVPIFLVIRVILGIIQLIGKKA